MSFTKKALKIGKYDSLNIQDFDSKSEFLIAEHLQQLMVKGVISDLVHNQKLCGIKYEKYYESYQQKEVNDFVQRSHVTYPDFTFRNSSGVLCILEYNGFQHIGIDGVYVKNQIDLLKQKDRDIALQKHCFKAGIKLIVLQVPTAGLEANDFFIEQLDSTILEKCINKAIINGYYILQDPSIFADNEETKDSL